MQPKTPKLLVDISDAASFILDSTRAATVGDYIQNRQMRQAVERNFEIIGEAVNRLIRLALTTAAKISNTEKTVAFRNVLIHGYDSIDDKEMWQVIINSVPKLLGEVERLLGTG